jgi:hypothetical protein
MTIEAEEPDVDQKSLSYKSRWNNLRSIGNSPIARASIAVPILGYIIVFHRDLIEYLKIHSSFCDGCAVSWRLHFLYFGSCFFAMGSILYGLVCPTLIKKYGGATEFFEGEKFYFTNPFNFQYLESLIRYDRRMREYAPKVLASIGQRGTGDPSDLYFLGGKMGEYYVLQNMSYGKTRLIVGFCYIAGSALLFIPTAWTFWQVLRQAVASIF